MGWTGLTGLLPGGRLGKSAFAAAGNVIFNALEALSSKCETYTEERALRDFAVGLGTEIIGDYLGDLVAKYGTIAVAKGLKKLDFDEAAEKLLRQVDDVADDAVGVGVDCSFSEDTLVSTDDGLQAISTLESGDFVLAYDETTGVIGYYPIIGVWVHEDPVVVHLTINGELIETTPEHPFYAVDGEWVAAGELQVGDEVRQADGSYGVVEAVAFVHQPQTMYNFTVATAHTYFVGDGQWLVHNHCGRWVTVNESMSDRAAAYQSRITGRPVTQAYKIGNAKFDGFDGSTLLDAKGPGYARFVRNGQFEPFFEGKQKLLNQAQRQINARGRSHPIVWHIAESEAADAIRKLLRDNGYGAITVKHTP